MLKRTFLLIMLLCFVVQAQDIQSTDILPEVVISGEGETTMLLISCMSCRWNTWEEFMARNGDRYTMYAVTVPGYGGTAVPEIPSNTEATPWRDNLLKGLSDLINAYKLKDVVVVGLPGA